MSQECFQLLLHNNTCHMNCQMPQTVKYSQTGDKTAMNPHYDTATLNYSWTLAEKNLVNHKLFQLN